MRKKPSSKVMSVRKAVSSKARRFIGKRDQEKRMLLTKAKDVQREEFVVCKFNVPRADYLAAKRIVAALEGELGSRIDLSNLGRGWLTRLVTAEKEIFEAAKHQQKLRTPIIVEILFKLLKLIMLWQWCSPLRLEERSRLGKTSCYVATRIHILVAT